MANWNSTQLTCNDLQKFTEIMKANPFTWPHTGGAMTDKPVQLINGEVYISSRWCLPTEEILKLSRENPDLIFTAEYSLESEEYDTIYVCTYQNGKQLKEVLKPQYHLIYYEKDNPEKYKNMMGEHFQKLYDRAVEIFTRMDIVKENETGEKYIDWVTDITLTVEDDDYVMKISKGRVFSFASLEITCLRKVKTTEITLQPIELLF